MSFEYIFIIKKVTEEYHYIQFLVLLLTICYNVLIFCPD